MKERLPLPEAQLFDVFRILDGFRTNLERVWKLL
jgi:hypothetical protein